MDAYTTRGAGRPWGRRNRPRGPLADWLHQNPRAAATLSILVTVGMIASWLMIALGLIIFLYFVVF